MSATQSVLISIETYLRIWLKVLHFRTNKLLITISLFNTAIASNMVSL